MRKHEKKFWRGLAFMILRAVAKNRTHVSTSYFTINDIDGFESMRKDFDFQSEIYQDPKYQTVKIEVLDGMAKVKHCPKGVNVEIIDHDNERTGAI